MTHIHKHAPLTTLKLNDTTMPTATISITLIVSPMREQRRRIHPLSTRADKHEKTHTKGRK